MKKLLLVVFLLINFPFLKAQSIDNVTNLTNAMIDNILSIGNLPPEHFAELNSILNNSKFSDEQKHNEIIGNSHFNNVVNCFQNYKLSYSENNGKAILSNPTLRDHFVTKLDEVLFGIPYDRCAVYKAQRGVCTSDFVTCMAEWGVAGLVTGFGYLAFAITGTVVCTGSLLSCYGLAEANYPNCVQGIIGNGNTGGGGSGWGSRKISEIIYPQNFITNK